MLERKELAMRAEAEMIKVRLNAAHHTHTQMGQDQPFRTKSVNSKRAQTFLLCGAQDVALL